jgi:hypothetical protein
VRSEKREHFYWEPEHIGVTLGWNQEATELASEVSYFDAHGTFNKDLKQVFFVAKTQRSALFSLTFASP